MILEEAIKRPLETVMNGDIGLGVDKGFRVIHLFLCHFRLGERLFLVELLELSSEIALNTSELFGVDFFEFFIKSLDLGFVFEVLEVNFVVADDLVEFLSDHQLLDVDSLETGDDLNHGVADFEEFFEVREQFGGFVRID